MLLIASILGCSDKAQNETGACGPLHCDITLSEEDYASFAGDDGVMDGSDCSLACLYLSCVGDESVFYCEVVGDRALSCEYSHACY